MLGDKCFGNVFTLCKSTLVDWVIEFDGYLRFISVLAQRYYTDTALRIRMGKDMKFYKERTRQVLSYRFLIENFSRHNWTISTKFVIKLQLN